MLLHCLKYNPTGNITVLVTTPVPRLKQPAVASRLLRPDCVGGEQAGFVETPTDPRAAARLQMMGGEFCGNATMSLGALLARKEGLQEGLSRDYLLEVSGSAGLVPCRILREGDGWIGTVEMPLPTAVEHIEIDTDAGSLTVPVVTFPGIAHLILPADAGLSEAQLRRRLPEWNRRLGADALGALLWSEADTSIDPLVFVPAAGTLVREHGCGSGSAAVGCWLALRAGRSVQVPVRQSGGTIIVRARAAAPSLQSLSITGRVTLMEEGEWEVGQSAE